MALSSPPASRPADLPALGVGERLKLLSRGANDAIFVVEPATGRILELNERALELTGRSAGELLGRPIWEVHPEAERESAEALLARVSRQGRGVHSALHFERPDGSVVALDISSTVVDVGGKRVIQRVCRDVTDQRRQRRELELSEARLRERLAFEELTTTMSARFITLPADLVDATLGEELERLGRFSGADRVYIYTLVGARCSSVQVWVREKNRVFSRERMLLDDFDWALEKLRENEHVIYSVDAEPRHWVAEGMADERIERKRHSLCVPMLTAERLVGFVGFDRLAPEAYWDDDTIRLLRMAAFVFANAVERREHQRALERANQELEAKVAERTAALEDKHRQLLQSEKLASLGQLVAGVAHEINTPLGALKSNVDTLGKAFSRLVALTEGSAAEPASVSLIETGRRLNDVSRSAVDRIARIVASLRLFARLDQSEVDRVDLRDGIRSTLVLVSHQFGSEVALEPSLVELPPVECYPNRLNQVFMNLIVNARQAIEGSGRVTVATRLATLEEARRVGADDGGAVVVTVADTGVGMAPATLARIFEPGFTTKGVGIGTGLGLSIVSQIVDEHAARLEVTSEPGQGSEFRLILPVNLERAAS